ncbi:MAG: Mrp/NBP35 family ATP-binding protein [Prevotellaceae bacterium]|jgi:ATP-binding protein involved in chromosome partitioning|nr:Mrp/NBP35 family ATP-binding protein [Prevotellaceae bacterium]
MKYDTEKIIKLLSAIKHPETGNDIVSTETVRNLEIDGNVIKMELWFKPNDAFVSSIKKAVETSLKNSFPAAELQLQDFKQTASPPRKKEYPPVNAKNIIAIASGKGGVGKSTVAVNIAVALAKKSYRTGLLDADVYGPSIPTMFAMHDAHPAIIEKDGLELIVPAEKFGIKILSIGFFVKPDDAIIWRGPAVTSAIKQLGKQTDWGELDFLLIDLPPGTGDVHLTIIQELKPTAAVIVTTPQQVALADVVRGISMFGNTNINIPVAGLIENMSWFTPAELPENKYYIFGKNGGKKTAEQSKIPFLGEIPLIQSVRESGDVGEPVVFTNSAGASNFMEVADNLLSILK